MLSADRAIRLVLSALLAAASAAPASAATVAGAGIVGGFSIPGGSSPGVQVGAYVGVPSTPVRVGADFTVFIIPGMRAYGGGPAAQLVFFDREGGDAYALLGLEIQHAEVYTLTQTLTATSVAVGGGGGIEAKIGPLRPYAESRLLVPHPLLELVAGLRVAF